MMKVLFLNRLRAGVRAEDYERWVREVDYPKARSLSSILSYEVVRMEGALADSPAPFDYVEIVTVTNLDEYRKDLASVGEDGDDFLEQLRSFLEPTESSYGRAIPQ